VGVPVSSTGGALIAAPIANGSGTTLRIFCERAGMAYTQFPERNFSPNGARSII